MGKHMNELANVEQELAELQSRLEKSFGVLDGLAQIPSQFEELGRTYHQLREYAEKTQTHLEQVEHLEKRFEQRYGELEKLMESRFSEVRSEITRVNDRLDQANGNLQQLDRLKNEVENKMGALLQEWTGSNEDIQAPLKDLDSRLNHLDTRTQMARQYVQDLEKQVKTLRIGMIGAIVAAVVSLILAIVLKGSQGNSASDVKSSARLDVNAQTLNL